MLIGCHTYVVYTCRSSEELAARFTFQKMCSLSFCNENFALKHMAVEWLSSSQGDEFPRFVVNFI